MRDLRQRHAPNSLWIGSGDGRLERRNVFPGTPLHFSREVVSLTEQNRRLEHILDKFRRVIYRK